MSAAGLEVVRAALNGDALSAEIIHAGNCIIDWPRVERTILQESPGAMRALVELRNGTAPIYEEALEEIRPSKNGRRRLPAPTGIRELLAMEEPAEDMLAEGFAPAGGNLLFAGYPKTFKTLLLLLWGVCLATGSPFLGRFPVPARRRVALVLMEDQAHRIRRRLRRLCQGLELDVHDLDGWLHLWFRPPLRLSDQTVLELGQYARELELDVLHIDSWAYVATGDSNSADEVTPQLQALSGLRLERPGITVGLTHHARKERGDLAADASRLTDLIRNSSAFGAWYDGGYVLTRKDESSPVTVRVELRDYPAPEAFAFTVEDQEPAGPHNGFRSGGWLRLQASGENPQTLERRAAVGKLVAPVREFLAEHPAGVSRTKLRGGVKGRHDDIEAAFAALEEAGEAVLIPAAGPGRSAVYRLTLNHPAQPCPNPARAGSPGNPAHPARPPEGGQGQGSTPAVRGADPAPGQGATCPDCGRAVGRPGIRCARCEHGGR